MQELQKDGVISTSLGFYLYELLGVDYSGVYVCNVELKELADKFGLSIKLADTQKMFGEMMMQAKQKGVLSDILTDFATILEKRIDIYESLLATFPAAEDSIRMWIIKAKRAVTKIHNAKKELKNG